MRFGGRCSRAREHLRPRTRRFVVWGRGQSGRGKERGRGRARSERRWVRGECAQMRVQSPVRSGGGVLSGVMCSLAVLIYVFCAMSYTAGCPRTTARRTECGDDSPALRVAGVARWPMAATAAVTAEGSQPERLLASATPPGPRRGPRANTTGANNALQGTRDIISRAPASACCACGVRVGGVRGAGVQPRRIGLIKRPATRPRRPAASTTSPHAPPPWPMSAPSALLSLLSLLSVVAPAQRRRAVLDDHIFSAVAKGTPSEGLVANAATPAAREREVSQGGDREETGRRQGGAREEAACARARCATAGGVHGAHHGASAVLLYVGTAVWARPAASQSSWAQRPPRAHPSGDYCTQIPTALHLPLVLAQEAHDCPLTVIVVPNANRALRAINALEVEPLGPLLILLSLRYLRRNRVKCPRGKLSHNAAVEHGVTPPAAERR